MRKFKQQQDYEIADKQDKESDAENSYIDISAAESYYYSCDFELMHVHNDFLDRKIDKNEFNNKSNEIYEKYKLNFGDLIESTDEIDRLNRQKNDKIPNDLPISLQNKAMEYFNNRDKDRTDEE